MRLLTSLAAALVVGGASLACSSGGPGTDPYGRTSCELPADCPLDFACVERVCVEKDSTSLFGVHIELTPPPGAPYVKTQLHDVDLTGDSPTLDVVLPEPATVRVLVFDDRGSQSRPINARLSLAWSDGIPGRDQVLTTDLIVGNARTETLTLNPGEYEATLTSSDFPSSLGAGFTVRAGSGSNVTKEFHFGLPRRIFGTVSSSVLSEEKLKGVRVTAFSTTSGLASTTDVTDVTGVFSIELPSTPDTSFLVTAEADAAAQPTWGYEEVVIVPQNGDREKNIALEPTRLDFRGPARLRFGGESGDGFVGVVGASVTLTASVAVSTRVYRILGTTDAEGYFVLRDDMAGNFGLIRGTYTVEVEPPRDSPFGHTVRLLDLRGVSKESEPDLQISLAARRRFRGTVLSDQGPVGYASIDLRPIDSTIAPAFAVTDPAGVFEVWLDPGPYLLAVLPLDRVGGGGPLPVFLDTITVPDEEAPSSSFRIPPGSPLTGSVLGALDLAPVANTQIEVLFEYQGRTVSIGTGMSDLDGRFSILLPQL